MGCFQNRIFCHQFVFSILILVIYSSSHSRLFNAEGRRLTQTADNSKSMNEDEKLILRGRIGSQPPRCDRRCSSCEHCEAIQVPTNPQIRRKTEIANSTAVSVIAYARGYDNSNYKPMSWKCKCGNLIFNP
ncbi:hypothetical protein CASFOL_015333 [Castilleja foliolosa]|uniref:Epidermal patterning factor-like protein n=1 Tax=Castilleja foliolosa TaxID=1961234 RepID=A0ABD3DDD9_9LAMI